MFLPADLVNPPMWSAEDWVDHQCRARTGVDIAELDADGALDTLAAARRARARADAQEAHALTRLEELRGDNRYVADEAAFELRTSRSVAGSRVERAKNLKRMPRLLAAMDAGEVEGYPAERITQAAAMLSDEQAGQVDEALAEKVSAGTVRGTDPQSLLRAARRLVTKVDPDGTTARARKARAERKLELIPGEHAMSTLMIDLPCEVAASIYGRVDGMARKLRSHGDERTLDQLRADVAAGALLGEDPGVGSPTGAAAVFLHVPIGAALGLNDAACELAGYGPLPAAVAREIMSERTSLWRKVLCDPASGAVRDVGRTRYRPTQAIRDFVAVRDAECTTPNCHRPAARCEQDHLHEWARHGVTAAGNLGPKCRHCHRLKDEAEWGLHFDPDTGVSTVTTPAGRTYTKVRHVLTDEPEQQESPERVAGRAPPTTPEDPPPF